ncbi:agmatine deiminase family protein [Candidatus Uhrbacteria bacterium]|nr:agmatine deiminase family protein [Candidatus Uhrbacteria bacterium]
MYRMPAEWEQHEGTWIAWPHNEEHWPGKFKSIPPVYGELVRALIEGGEKVFILVNDAEAADEAREYIKSNSADIVFHHIPTNSSWTRDFGPIFVYDEGGKLHITDWGFNMWGDKYQPWDLDAGVPKKIAALFEFPRLDPNMILEGGSIDVNGQGVLLTTRQCLLNKNRNPSLTQPQIEERLSMYLGIRQILWLDEGIVGDDTDGHIDDIARFTDSNTIICQMERDTGDGNAAILQKNFEFLSRARNQKGEQFHIVALDMPDPVYCDGQRLPASYANFYIANTAVLVPTFNCAKDARALDTFSRLFPSRRIIGIDAVDYVWGLGTIHCSTQQQPKAR